MTPETFVNAIPVPAGHIGADGRIGAINDALASANAQPIDMPCTPQKIWQALRDARPA